MRERVLRLLNAFRSRDFSALRFVLKQKTHRSRVRATFDSRRSWGNVLEKSFAFFHFSKIAFFLETYFWVGGTVPRLRGCELHQLRKQLSMGVANSPDNVSTHLAATNKRFNLNMNRASQCGAASSHTATTKKHLPRWLSLV